MRRHALDMTDVVMALVAMTIALAGAGCEHAPAAADGGAPGCYPCTLDARAGAPDGRDGRGAGDGHDGRGEEVGGGPGHPCGLAVIDVAIEDAPWETLHADPNRSVEVPVVLFFDGRRFDDVALELHGGYARTVPKKSYRFRLPEDESGADPRLAVFGPDPEQHRRVVLQAAWIDPTFVRNALTLSLVRELGGLAPRVTFVELRFNGAYHGLYTAIERVDRIFLAKHDLARDCNLYKAENHNANWADKDDPLAGYDRQLGEEQSAADLAALLAALSHTPATHADFEREIAPRLSLRQHRVWTAVHVLADDRDAFTKNYYLHHDPAAAPGTPADRFRIVSWDADATWGISWDGTRVEADGRRWRGHDAFSPRLYGIDAYRRAYLETLRDALGDGPLALDALLDRTAGWRTQLAACAERDLAHWERGVDFAAEMDDLDAAIRTRHAVLSDVVAELLAP